MALEFSFAQRKIRHEKSYVFKILIFARAAEHVRDTFAADFEVFRKSRTAGQRRRCGARERRARRGKLGPRTVYGVVRQAAVLVCGGVVVEYADALKMRCLLVAAALSERENWCVLFGTVSRIGYDTWFAVVERSSMILY